MAEELQRQIGEVPDWVRTLTYSWFVAGAKHLSFLDRFTGQLADCGYEVLALKGASLIPTVYAGRCSCRPLSDLDLLILPEQEEAIKTLRETEAELPNVRAVIDWHRNLVDDDRFPTKARLLQLTVPEIWTLSHLFKPGVRHLEPELQFIHLSLHAFKHSCCRLIWLVDQALVLRTCHLPRLLDLAKRVGAERPVLVSLWIIRRLLRQDLPENQLGKLRWHECLAVWLTCRRGHEWGWGELFLIVSVPGLGNKLKYLLEYLFPGPKVLAGYGPKNRLRASIKRAWRFLRNKNRTRG